MKTALITSLVLSPFILGSCATNAGNAVAGAAVYKAVDDKQEEERKEDLAWAKYHNNKDKPNNNNGNNRRKDR